MINEERLKKVALQNVWENQDHSWVLGDFTEVEAAEVLRLARLGLWAEKEGIPTLEAFAQGTSDSKEWCSLDRSESISTKWFHGVVSGERAVEALAPLRKEKK